jgi:hypothetical protein
VVTALDPLILALASIHYGGGGEEEEEQEKEEEEEKKKKKKNEVSYETFFVRVKSYQIRHRDVTVIHNLFIWLLLETLY